VAVVAAEEAKEEKGSRNAKVSSSRSWDSDMEGVKGWKRPLRPRAVDGCVGKVPFYSKSVAHARGRRSTARRHPFISPASLLLEMEEEGQQVTSHFTGQSIQRHSRVIIYEPMNEMMELGHLPTTEGPALFFARRERGHSIIYLLGRYIIESYKLEIADGGHKRRTEGIRYGYRKNEVYLDIIESVNMLVGAGWNPLSRLESYAFSRHTSSIQTGTSSSQRY